MQTLILWQTSHRGFTFFELLIVILLISILYGLFIQNIDFSQKGESYKFSEIKSFLLTYQDPAEKKKTTLICYDRCRQCGVFQDGKKIDDAFAPAEEMEVFTMAKDGILEEVEYPRIELERHDYDVCLKYSLYPNGSSDRLIVTYGEAAYLFHPYFQKTEIFSDSHEAQEKLLEIRALLRD